MTSTSKVTGKVQPDLRTDSQIPTGLNESEKGVYETLLRVKNQRTKPPPDVFVITDIAKDYDDLVAMILLKELHRLGLIRLKGFVANLKPAQERAEYGRGALDALGLQDIPIAWGKDATTQPDKVPEYEFDYPFKPKNCTFIERKEKPHSEDAREIESGFCLLERCMLEGKQKGTPGGLTFLLISSLEDISTYVKNHEKEFVEGAARVVLQGGYKIGPSNDNCGLEVDATAMNNVFDEKSAKGFYKVIADKKIPSIAYTRIAASAAGMLPKFFDDLRATGHILGEHLLDRYVKQELEYYESSQGPNHPPGRDQENYLNVRTTWYDTHKGADKKPEGEAILLYVKLVLYDVLAALDTAGEDAIAALGVLPKQRGEINEFTARHRIIGTKGPETGKSDGGQEEGAVDSGIDVGKMQLALTALLKGSLLLAVEQGFGRKENYD